MDTQLNALPALPALARTVSGCLNSAFSRHFYTFYGPSVQALDTQLKALPILPVLARTVSGCLNCAFLGLERNRSLFTTCKDFVGMNARGKTGKLEKRGRDAAVSGKPVRKVGNFVVPLSASACAVCVGTRSQRFPSLFPAPQNESQARLGVTTPILLLTHWYHDAGRNH